MSPAAESRVPPGQTAALDPECRSHPVFVGNSDAAAAAEQIFEKLVSGKASERAYWRAQSMGRLLHFVADSAVSTEFLQPEKPVTSLFSFTDFLVFRTRMTLSKHLAASLRELGRQARWADPSASASAAAFRTAVNLTIEALLLLPPETGSASATDEGPSVFLLNRQRPVAWADLKPAMGSLQRRSVLTDEPGLHVVEWCEKKTPSSTRIQALLFNNTDDCASQIELSVLSSDEFARMRRGAILPSRGWEKWSRALNTWMAPRSLRIVELEAPPGIPYMDIRRRWVPRSCPAQMDLEHGYPVRRYVPVTLVGKPPAIDNSFPEQRLGQ
jgi:hypothetical protein